MALRLQGKLRLNELSAEVAKAEGVLLTMWLNFDRRGTEASFFSDLALDAEDARAMCFAHQCAPMDKVREIFSGRSLLVRMAAVGRWQTGLRAAAMGIQDGSEIGTGATRLNYRNDMHFENIVVFVCYVIFFFLFAFAERSHCLPLNAKKNEQPYGPQHGRSHARDEFGNVQCAILIIFCDSNRIFSVRSG